ncbi:hypothetical protein BDZ94DRAFT_1305907 [Collybia nuda]|uniref:F-box domain-containing protein n=1 Tax=Collybia nuda TaxID=64659 RepID=A0A9P5YF28_9AGAR|nr:hypothetical protein BDZ94DRAFT_1305907 [Collybia nuda]
MLSPLSQPVASKFLSLPPELVEQVLILLAAGGFPSTIACLGQTCHYFHQLIFDPADNHLWREIFLTTFDDPRPLLGRLRAATTFAPIGDTRSNTEPLFDWVGEFTRRMDAKKTFEKYASRDNNKEIPPDLSQALKSLLAVLESASPFSPHQNNDFTTITPTFPPIIILHASPIPFPAEFKSRSSSWLEDVLKVGYPSYLIQKFLMDGHQRRQRKQGLEEAVWENSDEGKLFHKLVFLKGFLPLQYLPEADTSDIGTLNRSNSSSASTRSSQASIDEQLATAREMARTRVYNLRYLMPERCWGPFLPNNGKAREAILRTRFPDFEEEISRQITNVDGGVEHNSQLIHITSDANERFYPFLTIDGSNFYRADDEDLPSRGSDDDDDDDDLNFVTINGHAPDATFIAPKPHQVVPDYAFLAAARLLVEMNLREVLALDTNEPAGNPSVDASVSRLVDAFACLDLMRMGAAPSFWSESWSIFPNQQGEDFELLLKSPLDYRNGKGKARDTDDFEGWDWAGVTGEWKRSVCWLDYRDLLLHNLTGFPRENLEETMRIFPMTLRVSGYSKPPEPDLLDEHSPCELESLVWRLPVIHIEGESKGSDVDSTVIRRVKGCVRMIGDGAIRWSLTSSYPDEDSPEWLTEAVQIGSIGSAVGMLGMWTGAEHASTDPLGPVWAWKVA